MTNEEIESSRRFLLKRVSPLLKGGHSRLEDLANLAEMSLYAQLELVDLLVELTKRLPERKESKNDPL